MARLRTKSSRQYGWRYASFLRRRCRRTPNDLEELPVECRPRGGDEQLSGIRTANICFRGAHGNIMMTCHADNRQVSPGDTQAYVSLMSLCKSDAACTISGLVCKSQQFKGV